MEINNKNIYDLLPELQIIRFYFINKLIRDDLSYFSLMLQGKPTRGTSKILDHNPMQDNKQEGGE